MLVQDLFLGSDQSKYAAMAIVISLIAVAFTVLFSKEKIPFGQKLVIVVLMFLLSLPAMLFSLFQITCLVTGTGFRNSKWWCGAYAWLMTLIIIIYTVVIVVMSIMSLTVDTEMKKVEQFYAQKDMYDTFANNEMEDGEKQKEEEAALAAAMAANTPTTSTTGGAEATAAPMAVPTPVVTSTPPPPPSDMTPPGVQVGPVEPVMEPFTSCGAAWTNTY